MDYNDVDVNAIINTFQNNETKINELTKYISSSILPDLSLDNWVGLSRDKIVNEIKKIQKELESFNRLVDSIRIDLNCIEQIKKYNSEIAMLKKENSELSLNNCNDIKIAENNNIIDGYEDIIKRNEKNLKKWREI